MSLIRKAKKTLGVLAGDELMTALNKWQGKLQDALCHYEPELTDMGTREDQYAGTRKVAPSANAKKQVTKDASNIRNITFELIESEVDSNIPTAKVSPLHPWNEERARAIESMLRSQMDRLPIEYLNDEQERTCPIQGGSVMLVEWDNTRRSHTTVGEVAVTLLHPKQVIPQPGVTSLQKCDYIFVQLAQTKEYIKRRYEVDVDNEAEARPEVDLAALSDHAPPTDTKVTQNIVFFRNDDGSIGKFSWVNDTPLEYFENYQARHLEVCAKCGQARPAGENECACGSRSWEYTAQECETLDFDLPRSDGTVIPAMSPLMLDGEPVLDPLSRQPVLQQTRLPYYAPNRYPLVVRKNMSVFGRFYGESDVDKIRDQQLGSTMADLDTQKATAQAQQNQFQASYDQSNDQFAAQQAAQAAALAEQARQYNETATTNKGQFDAQQQQAKNDAALQKALQEVQLFGRVMTRETSNTLKLPIGTKVSK